MMIDHNDGDDDIDHDHDFSHNIVHTIQHIIKCEQDMTMMNQMFLFFTIRQLWRSILVPA